MTSGANPTSVNLLKTAQNWAQLCAWRPCVHWGASTGPGGTRLPEHLLCTIQQVIKTLEECKTNQKSARKDGEEDQKAGLWPPRVKAFSTFLPLFNCLCVPSAQKQVKRIHYACSLNRWTPVVDPLGWLFQINNAHHQMNQLLFETASRALKY